MIRMVTPSGGDMWVRDDRVKEYEGRGCKLPTPPAPAHPIRKPSTGKKKTTK